jgi:hypothetical protein
MLLKKSATSDENATIESENFLNQCCALGVFLESKLLTRPPQNRFSTAWTHSRLSVHAVSLDHLIARASSVGAMSRPSAFVAPTKQDVDARRKAAQGRA